ncbi:hypothetical protein EV424DRAFT_1392935 [Suillus variegatus]|nr:hypothetical protein EV424DRAFT_1392935 [Suillus variegatus]
MRFAVTALPIFLVIAMAKLLGMNFTTNTVVVLVILLTLNDWVFNRSTWCGSAYKMRTSQTLTPVDHHISLKPSPSTPGEPFLRYEQLQLSYPTKSAESATCEGQQICCSAAIQKEGRGRVFAAPRGPEGGGQG